MVLQNTFQLYSGPLSDLSLASAPVSGIPAWTTDSQELFVSKGGTYVRAAASNKVWSVSSASSLYTVIPAAGGHALVGDIVIVTGTNTTYILTNYANKIWSSSTLYSLGDTIIDSNGNLQTVTIAGQSGGTQPMWSFTGTTIDNGITWTEGSGFVAIASAGAGGGTVLSVNGQLPNVAGNVSLTQDNIPAGATYTAVAYLGSATAKEWIQWIDSTGIQHLSAIHLTDLNDVNITSPSDGNLLSYNASSGKWVNAAASPSGITQLTGDVLAGPGAGSQSATLATTGVSAGTYTNATITVDAKGRITDALSGASTYSPNIFYSGKITASGNTAIWTPAAGKSFRLLKYQIEGTMNVAQTAQGVITITLVDGSTSTPFVHDVYVSSPGLRYNNIYQSGWIDLGGNGYLSNAANNVLNINLSYALTQGNFRVFVCGIEQ